MSAPQYELERFQPHIARWLDHEQPDHELVVALVNWIDTRRSDPYRGVTREPRFDNLWYGRVPGTLHRDGTAIVYCGYWIFEREHVVRCESIATLGTW